jgi:hypothetical protein
VNADWSSNTRNALFSAMIPCTRERRARARFRRAGQPSASRAPSRAHAPRLQFFWIQN